MIQNNTLSGNTGEEGGGGIQVVSAAAVIAGNLIDHNLSYNGGAGIGCADSTAKIINNTITRNHPAASISFENGSPVIANNIIAFGTSALIGEPGVADIRNNCLYGNTTEDYSEDLNPGPGDFSGQDPLFVNRDTGDFHLGEGSSCLEAGDDSLVSGGWLDLDGTKRVKGAHVDLGAYELTRPVLSDRFNDTASLGNWITRTQNGTQFLMENETVKIIHTVVDYGGDYLAKQFEPMSQGILEFDVKLGSLNNDCCSLDVESNQFNLTFYENRIYFRDQGWKLIGTVPLEGWNHFQVIFNPGLISIYVNGNIQYTQLGSFGSKSYLAFRDYGMCIGTVINYLDNVGVRLY